MVLLHFHYGLWMCGLSLIYEFLVADEFRNWVTEREREREKGFFFFVGGEGDTDFQIPVRLKPPYPKNLFTILILLCWVERSSIGNTVKLFSHVFYR